MLRPHADDDEEVRLAECVDQLLHQTHICRAEAAQAQVDNRATGSLDLVRDLVRPAYARGEPIPRLPEGVGSLVVGVGGIEVQVEEGRLVDELALRQRRRAVCDAELAELTLERFVQLAVARPELLPA